MFKIQILGMGPGSKEFISPIVISLIKEVDVIIAGKRHLSEVKEEIKKKEQYFITSDLVSLVNYIKNNREKKIAILVSGDPGFYSFLIYLKNYFSDKELVIIPGISSMQYMFCKTGIPWQEALLKSLHGKSFDYIEALKNYSLIGLLTDNKNTPQHIAQTLTNSGWGNITIYIGESLSYKEEKITKILASKLVKEEKKFEMNVVILKKELYVSH